LKFFFKLNFNTDLISKHTEKTLQKNPLGVKNFLEDKQNYDNNYVTLLVFLHLVKIGLFLVFSRPNSFLLETDEKN